ncbi:protein YqgB [Bacillus sp. C30]|uniref:protein YqgB n=1 Tax=Bacillus sp. C30 TaxID=1387733 RepID=UPI00349F829F
MSIFTQIAKSVYSPKDMALFRFQKIGKTILYIMLLCLITTIPRTFLYGSVIQDGVNMVNKVIEKDLPDFKIENGELTADIDQPIEKEDGNALFVFDPNSTDLEKYQNKTGLFVLKDKVVSMGNGQTQTYSYNDLLGVSLEKKDLQDFISLFDSIYPILLFVIGFLLYLFQLFITFVGVTLLAFIGSAMSGQRKLSYKQVWTLTAYSYTIPTIFFMIMDLFKINVPGATFIYIAVVLIVLYLTIKEVPKPKEKQEL